jgi:hypothetical protein
MPCHLVTGIMKEPLYESRFDNTDLDVVVKKMISAHYWEMSIGLSDCHNMLD